MQTSRASATILRLIRMSLGGDITMQASHTVIAKSLAMAILCAVLVTSAPAQTPDTPLWRACSADENWPEQIKSCTQIIQDNRETTKNRAVAYYHRATAYWASNPDVNLCIADLTRALELDPRYVDAYEDRAVARTANKDYDGSAADWTKLIGLQPQHPRAYGSRAWAYAHMGKLTEGLADANQALAQQGDAGMALGARALIYETLGRRDEAIADYRRALASSPKWQHPKDALTRLGVAP